MDLWTCCSENNNLQGGNNNPHSSHYLVVDYFLDSTPCHALKYNDPMIC